MTTTVNLLDVLTAGRKLPKGCTHWGIKSVRPDLRTYNDYQWPLPGLWAECDPERINRNNREACPSRPGDGLCVALTWDGMASGGIPARTLLLVAYNGPDRLSRSDNPHKLRASRVRVVALIDGERLVREYGARANLYGANLSGANLYGADLYGANLSGANLRGAHLSGAHLSGADLRGTDLSGADLSGADLSGADLSGGTCMSGADLSGADLSGAHLNGADLYGALGLQEVSA